MEDCLYVLGPSIIILFLFVLEVTCICNFSQDLHFFFFSYSLFLFFREAKMLKSYLVIYPDPKKYNAIQKS